MWGVMLIMLKVFIMLFLLCLWEQRTPWQFSKQISKLSLQSSVQVYSLLGQTEEEKKAFFRGCKEGGLHRKITPKSTCCHKG